MMCEKCGINPAAVTLTQVINGKKTVKKLCVSCAQENNLYNFNMDLGFSGIFSSFFNEGEKAKAPDTKCPLCSMTLSEFLNGDKIGCASCYTAFESAMAPLLKKIHLTTTHSGKVLGKPGSTSENKIDLLKSQLKEAIEKEEYEKAATLRDEIKEMEGRM